MTSHDLDGSTNAPVGEMLLQVRGMENDLPDEQRPSPMCHALRSLKNAFKMREIKLWLSLIKNAESMRLPRFSHVKQGADPSHASMHLSCFLT